MERSHWLCWKNRSDMIGSGKTAGAVWARKVALWIVGRFLRVCRIHFCIRDKLPTCWPGQCGLQPKRCLCQARVYATRNPIASADQKGNDFWSAVAKDLYTRIIPRDRGNEARTFKAARLKYTAISQDGTKFVGHLNRAQRQRASGQSEDDVLHAAVLAFARIEPRAFAYTHCWRELRNEPKYMPHIGDSPQISGEGTAHAVDDRPIGQKRAKTMKSAEDLRVQEVKQLRRLPDAVKERSTIMKERSKVIEEQGRYQQLQTGFILMTQASPATPEAREYLALARAELLSRERARAEVATRREPDLSVASSAASSISGEDDDDFFVVGEADHEMEESGGEEAIV